ncbi:DUF2383 domain-containing protein [Thermohalobacter berrensis]|uniref:DUF2383 domain-containing protein n=1 Tax=Thermohalobacter berrensis TaxID=99594 RepID=A0A419SWE3_9FIRM|nr:DUF2383 domain-containing protein [Thermohalobacter berrensis]RKD29521.1 hypothetical protein BET03_05530 [Thermohalobacter berrensis]
MDSKEKERKALNQLLQGEQMAVETFNIFISKVKDNETKKIFQEVQKQHRKNIFRLADYIQNLGGQPDENIGLKGIMADYKLNNQLNDKDNLYIIEKAIEGETKGINMAEKVLRGKLDDKSRKLAGDILHQDRMSLSKLQSLI